MLQLVFLIGMLGLASAAQSSSTISVLLPATTSSLSLPFASVIAVAPTATTLAFSCPDLADPSHCFAAGRGTATLIAGPSSIDINYLDADGTASIYATDGTTHISQPTGKNTAVALSIHCEFSATTAMTCTETQPFLDYGSAIGATAKPSAITLVAPTRVFTGSKVANQAIIVTAGVEKLSSASLSVTATSSTTSSTAAATTSSGAGKAVPGMAIDGGLVTKVVLVIAIINL